MNAPHIAPSTTASGRLRRLALEGMRFIGSGILVFPLGLGVAALCRHYFGWRQEIAVVAAFATLLCVNFMLGRAFVFRSSAPIKRELGRFMGTALVMRAFESLFSIALMKLSGISYLYAIAATLCVSSMLKFLVYRSWVFGRAAPSAATPESAPTDLDLPRQ